MHDLIGVVIDRQSVTLSNNTLWQWQPDTEIITARVQLRNTQVNWLHVVLYLVESVRQGLYKNLATDTAISVKYLKNICDKVWP